MKIYSLFSCILFVFTWSCTQEQSSIKTDDSVTKVNDTSIQNTPVFQEENDTTISNQLIKDYHLFWIRDIHEDIQKNVALVSVSDLYLISEHPDSLAIPPNNELENFQYFQLEENYRKNFFERTIFSESDSLFLLDYQKNILLSFPLSKLNLVAYLSIYVSTEECPCEQYDYLIGFEIELEYLQEFSNYYEHSYAYIGPENPFVKDGLSPIQWNTLKQKKFPIDSTQYKKELVYPGSAYSAETDNYEIYLQEGLNQKDGYVDKSILLVLDKSTNKVICESFFVEDEGSSLAPLNYGIKNSGEAIYELQWLGSLFKNRPDVIFGFQWHSFGCPNIKYLDGDNRSLPIHCDNRH